MTREEYPRLLKANQEVYSLLKKHGSSQPIEQKRIFLPFLNRKRRKIASVPALKKGNSVTCAYGNKAGEDYIYDEMKRLIQAVIDRE